MVTASATAVVEVGDVLGLCTASHPYTAVGEVAVVVPYKSEVGDVVGMAVACLIVRTGKVQDTGEDEEEGRSHRFGNGKCSRWEVIDAAG